MTGRRHTEKENFSSKEIKLPEHLVHAPDFIKKAREIILREDLLSTDEAEKLLGNSDLINRLMQVTQYAHAILSGPGEKLTELIKNKRSLAIRSALREWELAVFHFYALTAPTFEPDTVPAISQAEKYLKDVRIVTEKHGKRKTTALKSLSRDAEIWTSQMGKPRILKSDYTNESLQFLKDTGDLEELKNREKIKEDIERWFGPAGLLLHTAVASWSMETMVDNLQKYIHSEIPAEEYNKWHHYLLEISPYLGRAWLNLHDLGRLVTHDPYDHAVLTHVICEMAGLKRSLYNDYDLPDILQLGHETPLIKEFVVPKKEIHAPGTATDNKVSENAPMNETENGKTPTEELTKEEENALRVEYVNTILEKLEEIDYQNPVAVLVFWLIDAYSKLYDLPNQRTLSSRTDHIDPQEIAKKFGDYANLQPGDEEALFLGRFRYRQHQNGGTEDNLDELSEADKKNYRYYSRQYELARSIFIWIQEELRIPEQLMWLLISSFTERNNKNMDQNGDFLFHTADPHLKPFERVVETRQEAQLQTETAEERTARILKESRENSAKTLQKIRARLANRSNS